MDFEIVDLGVGSAGDFSKWGPSTFGWDRYVCGQGATALLALQDAMNKVALDGVDTSEVEEAAREEGWFAPESEDSATEVRDDYEEDIPEPVYFVGIRYNDPDGSDEDDSQKDDE